MSLVINTTGGVSRAEFERLYAEAEDYISVERKRLGNNIKEILWDTLEMDEAFVHRYELDGYLVGCAALSALDIPWQGVNERWAWYRTPVYGETESGSRAWWYSEGFQKAARDWCDADGFDRVLAIHNPTSPAALAVSATWGQSWEGRQYYERPEVYTLEETFGDARDAVGVPDTMRCFVIGKYNG